MTSSPPPQPRRRRRGRLARIGRVLVVTLLALVLVGSLGVGWYFSDQALVPTTAGSTEVQLRAYPSEESPGTSLVAVRDEGFARTLGLHGVRLGTGDEVTGLVGDIVEIRDGEDGEVGEVIREWIPEEGTPGPEVMTGTITQDVYRTDPSVHGLDFEEVTVETELGGMPAWLVPAPGGTDWVVYVHGRGGTRTEGLRYLPALHEAGFTTLLITYRNDEGVPADPSGHYRFGATEGRDVDAAVAHATASGAERVVLFGTSMGGGAALHALVDGEHADVVDGVWLDSPALDWRHVLRSQGAAAGLPGPLTSLGMAVTDARMGIGYDDLDWVARAEELPDDVPVHVVHPDGDVFVPNDPSTAFSEARPDVVTLDTSSPADHTRAWNVDPEGYDAELTAWLGGLPSRSR